MSTDTDLEPLAVAPYELDRIVTLKRAAELMGVHVDTVRRNYRDKFVWISPRRCGLRLRDALLLADPPKPG